MGNTLTAQITVPVSLTGKLFGPGYVSASIAIPLGIAVNLNAPLHVGGESGITIPSLHAYGEGFAGVPGQASLIIPKLSLSGVGRVSSVGNAAFDIPGLRISANGVVSVVGRASLVLPRLTIETDSYFYITGNASIRLPSLRASAFLDMGNQGSLSETLPELRIFASGFSSVEGSASITLPAFRLYAAIAPSEYLSLVLNVKNKALTEYGEYGFNSICNYNGVALGAKADGIYSLDIGEKDDGEQIDWNFRTLFLPMEQEVKKRLRQAWLSYKSSGDLIVTVVQPDGESYEYQLDGLSQTDDGARVKIGKGIKSKFVALDIKNVEGSSIVLDVLKLHYDQFNDKQR